MLKKRNFLFLGYFIEPDLQMLTVVYVKIPEVQIFTDRCIAFKGCEIVEDPGIARGYSVGILRSAHE